MLTYYSRIRRDSACNTFQDLIITSVIDAKKITAWEESGFPARFLGSVLLMLCFRSVVYSVRGAVFFMATLFSVTVGEQVQTPLIAVGILLQQKRAGSLPPFCALTLRIGPLGRFYVPGV